MKVSSPILVRICVVALLLMFTAASVVTSYALSLLANVILLAVSLMLSRNLLGHYKRKSHPWATPSRSRDAVFTRACFAIVIFVFAAALLYLFFSRQGDAAILEVFFRFWFLALGFVICIDTFYPPMGFNRHYKPVMSGDRGLQFIALFGQYYVLSVIVVAVLASALNLHLESLVPATILSVLFYFVVLAFNAFFIRFNLEGRGSYEK